MSKKPTIKYLSAGEDAPRTWVIKIDSIDAIGPVQRRTLPSGQGELYFSGQREFHFPVVCNGQTFIIGYDDKEVIERWYNDLVQAWIAVL